MQIMEVKGRQLCFALKLKLFTSNKDKYQYLNATYVLWLATKFKPLVKYI